MLIIERYEALCKAIYGLHNELPRNGWSARHLVTRTKGLALQDFANRELHVALVDTLGAKQAGSVKSLGQLLVKIQGRRYGDYELVGRFVHQDDARRQTWSYVVIYHGEPPAKPKEPTTIKQLLVEKRTEEKRDAAQQVRLEKAETREVREELKTTERRQRKAFKAAGADDSHLDDPEMHNPKMTRREAQTIWTQPRWEAGLKFWNPNKGQECTYGGTAEAKTITIGGKVWDFVEVATHDGETLGQKVAREYVENVNRAALNEAQSARHRRPMSEEETRAAKSKAIFGRSYEW